MSKPFAAWQIHELRRLATLDPERAERAMNAVWEADPELYEHLAVMAVDQDLLSMNEGARLLGVDQAALVEHLAHLRRQERGSERMIVMEGGAARLEESHLAVWEIVREFRRIGSVEGLEDSFPALSRAEIATALKYAQAHPQEIENEIHRYEAAIHRKLAVYEALGR